MKERSVTMCHKCCSKQKVKRGLWSPEEDEKLIKCVAMHGHGCWTSVPKLAGLQRCGKSCRLRWINYLRPGIKRGSFSALEERIIIEVHSILGNRWAQIAKYLPGRSDNEVKNFWNSCIKKKLIAQGLDPKTQCLMPSHQTSSRINACSLYQIHPQPTSAFTVNPQMRDAPVEMNPNFITISPLPPDTNFSHFLPLEEAMTPTIHASTNFTNRSSTDSTSILPSINPSGFGFLDENCMWGTLVAPIGTLSKNEMHPQQEHLEQKKNVPRINKANEEKGDQKMEASFDNPNFELESVESTLMPGGINCSLSSMDQLAWDCQNFPFSHF